MHSVNRDRRISHCSLTVEEAHNLLRNLREAGVERLRADLHEHVTHVLHQEKLSTVTSCLEVSIELNRL